MKIQSFAISGLASNVSLTPDVGGSEEFTLRLDPYLLSIGAPPGAPPAPPGADLVGSEEATLEQPNAGGISPDFFPPIPQTADATQTIALEEETGGQASHNQAPASEKQEDEPETKETSANQGLMAPALFWLPQTPVASLPIQEFLSQPPAATPPTITATILAPTVSAAPLPQRDVLVVEARFVAQQEIAPLETLRFINPVFIRVENSQPEMPQVSALSNAVEVAPSSIQVVTNSEAFTVEDDGTSESGTSPIVESPMLVRDGSRISTTVIKPTSTGPVPMPTIQPKKQSSTGNTLLGEPQNSLTKNETSDEVQVESSSVSRTTSEPNVVAANLVPEVPAKNSRTPINQVSVPVEDSGQSIPNLPPKQGGSTQAEPVELEVALASPKAVKKPTTATEGVEAKSEGKSRDEGGTFPRLTGERQEMPPGQASIAVGEGRIRESDIAVRPRSGVPVREISTRLAERIDEMVATRRHGAVTIQLQPEDLGTLTVTIKSFGPRIDADITASNDNVRQALQENRQQLSQSIESRGMSLGHLNLSQHGEMGHGTQQQQQNAREDFQRYANVKLADPAPDDRSESPRWAPVNDQSVDYRI